MKKKIIVIVLVFAAFLSACQEKIDYNQLKIDFENLLNSGDYSTANQLFVSAEDQRIDDYKQSLDVFSANIIENAKNSMSAEDAKAKLNELLIFDYTRPQVQEALDYIIAAEAAVIASNASYVEGISLFIDRQFDAAYEKLSMVESFDENYQSAQEAMVVIESRNLAWENAAANNSTGRNPYLNSLAYSDGYIYFPVDMNDVHSIVKHNYTTGETLLFPLVEFVGTFHIRGINVIGDYMYFTAGEELGTGKMLEAPYNIYEMKTDGTGLTVVKKGDYFDLISLGNTFYALSYSNGFVKMDKDFANEEVISEKRIIEMQATQDGVYFTEKVDNTCESDHILYLYKDGAITEVMTKEMLHAYVFDGFSVFYNDRGENNFEEIFAADKDFANPVRLAILKDYNNGDIYNLIGAMGDTVMLNTAGYLPNKNNHSAMRQTIYSEIQISKKRIDNYQDSHKVPDYFVINVLYEEGVQLVKSADGTYSLTATPSNNALDHVITIPELDQTALETNMVTISENRPSDEDFYSEEEVVVEMDNFWYYSSPTLNVTIEEIYDESIETLIFLANIRTTDPTEFKIGYSDFTPPGIYKTGLKTDDIAQINNAVFATNGDFAMFANNNWVGKVIRDGLIYDGLDKGPKLYNLEDVRDITPNCKDYLAFYPDGTMVAYDHNDTITIGELIDAGVKNTVSFGPILVRDNKKTDACTDPTYYISGANPRCGWGMVEPGHYVAMVADGRQPSVSRGMSFYTMSHYFQSLGCSVAYNLDGGQTAAMSFMGRFINTHQNDVMWTNHRSVQEIIYFGTSDLVPYDLENYYNE